MLVPVSWTEMPFRFVVLHEDDRGSYTTTLPFDIMLQFLGLDPCRMLRVRCGQAELI